MRTQNLWVVEKDDGEALVGTIEFRDHDLVIRDGFVGRPTVVSVDDVQQMTLALLHPDVDQ